MSRPPALLALVVAATACIGRHTPDGAAAAMRRPPAQNTLTFWGHASVFLDIDGYGIVTDPVFDGWYSPLSKRKVPAPPDDALARVRLVLISHPHRDHLSPKSLRRLPRPTTVLCPVPTASYLEDEPVTVAAMRPGDQYDFPGGTITAVAADHAGGRNSLSDDPDGRALGYVIQLRGQTLYWSGDTEYFEGLAEIGRRFAPDVAILDINAHLNGADAVRAVTDIGAPVVIPIHHGAFTGRNDQRSPKWRGELTTALGDTVRTLAVGESVALHELAGRPGTRAPSTRTTSDH